jgi:carboxyl-terminal processing protease
MSRPLPLPAPRYAFALALIVTLALLLLVTLTPAAQAEELVLPAPQDLSGLSWTGAFAELHTKMMREYAFTTWKGIDWPALYDEYAPQIARAQWSGDQLAYYLTLRRYTQELRDGHVSISAEIPQAQAVLDAAYARLADGGFGIVPQRLDSGAVVAAWIQPGGPAAKAGMKAGARIVRWRGRPVNAAVARVDIALSPSFPTDARRDRERLRFLTRARVGATRVVTFRNRGAASARTARLIAIADDRITLTMTDERSTLVTEGWPEKVVEHQILPGNVGYVRVRFELDLPAVLPGDHTPTLQLFRKAVADFIAAEVSGVVVDVRANSGGSDQMVADMMASFYDQRSFYEYGEYLNMASGAWEIWYCDEATGAFTQRDAGIWIHPLSADERYVGPVVALVDNGCVSSGEGVAMGIRRLPHGKTVGFHGTNGSFGMVGDQAAMPGGYVVGWPYGRSLSASETVQIDSRGGRGGVAPEVRVPATWRNVSRQLRGRDVVLECGLRELAEMGPR